MSVAAALSGELRAVSFDCYGTLIDVAAGRGAFL
jgi:FMN phosphatase YigB (HAD superfamily)